MKSCTMLDTYLRFGGKCLLHLQELLLTEHRISRYTTCFYLNGHPSVYGLVSQDGLYKTTASAAGSSLGCSVVGIATGYRLDD
jgi:hypothetical protein